MGIHRRCELPGDFETRCRAVNGDFDVRWDYGNVKDLGELTYFFPTGQDVRRAGRLLRTNLLAAADRLVQARDAHGYARPAGTAYSWGGNGVVARQVVLLQAGMLHRFSPKPDYVTASLDALGHLLGRNYYGRSFVTGVGFKPPLHPHDRRSGAELTRAMAGYLVGGSNPGATNWQDVQANYRVNEIAINWNSALIYALAAFVSGTHQQ